MPQPRPRGMIMRRKGSPKPQVHIYDQLERYEKLANGKRGPRVPWDAAKWRDRIIERVRAEAVSLKEPIAGPIRLDVDFNFPRPGYMLTRKFPSTRIHHTGKPDRDNLEKLLLDAITQAGWREIGGETVKTSLVWKDDSQVCMGEVQKWFVARGDLPGACVIITRLLEPEPSLLDSMAIAGGAR